MNQPPCAHDLRMTDTELSTFDPDLADAVVRVLRRHGFDAWVGEPAGAAGAERTVHVASGARDRALALLADRMEEVTGELAEHRSTAGRRRPARAEPDAGRDGAGDDGSRPLVMERFRRAGLNLAVVLAPLLIVVLARPPFPLALTAVVLVAGMALIVALRDRQLRRRDDR